MMSSDIILKGEGVEFVDPESDDVHRVRFADEDNPFLNDYSHFHLHPETGEPIQGIVGRWPMEGVAHKLALDIMRAKGIPQDMWHDGQTHRPFLTLAHQLINAAASDFNIKMRKHSATHALPLPFEDGKLHPEWAKNHFAPYLKDNIPLHERPTRLESGGIHTLHMNNAPHPKRGHFPESATLPFFRELRERINKAAEYMFGDAKAIPSALGGDPHVEPHHFLLDANGNTFFNRKRTAAQGAIDSFAQGKRTADIELAPQHLLQIAPNEFFSSQSHHLSGGPKAIERGVKAGLDREQTAAIVGTPLGELVAASRAPDKNPAKSRFTKVLRQFQDMGDMGEDGENRDRLARMMGRIRSHSDWAGGGGMFNAAKELAATMLVLREMGASLNMDRTQVTPKVLGGMEKFLQHYGPDDVETLTVSPTEEEPERKVEQQNVFNVAQQAPHVVFQQHAPMDVPRVEPRVMAPPPVIQEQPPVVQEELPLPPTRQVRVIPPREEQPLLPDVDAAGFPLFRGAADSLYNIMERLQVSEAQLDDMLMKSLPNSKDVSSLASHYNITEQDVRAVQHGAGDWEKLAKALHLSYDVVRAIKVASR